MGKIRFSENCVFGMLQNACEFDAPSLRLLPVELGAMRCASYASLFASSLSTLQDGGRGGFRCTRLRQTWLGGRASESALRLSLLLLLRLDLFHAHEVPAVLEARIGLPLAFALLDLDVAPAQAHGQQRRRSFINSLVSPQWYQEAICRTHLNTLVPSASTTHTI